MKAITFHRYGSIEELKLEEVATPIPKENEVLIKVYATTVTSGDCEMRRFDVVKWIWLPLRMYMGFFKPRIKILGQELAGKIEETGIAVTKFSVGDLVFAPTEMKLGAHAEYICLPETKPIAFKPSNVSFEEAATIPTGGLNALHFLKKGGIGPGLKVLINGAGGSIGSYAIQIAKYHGAHVTAVDSGQKLGLLQSIGADQVMDYESENFTNNIAAYDIIIDIVGKASYTGCLAALKPNGRLVIGNPSFSGLMNSLWTAVLCKFFGRRPEKKVINAMAPYTTEDLNELGDLLAARKIKAVIDKRFILNTMSDAHRYVETGLKEGHVVITVA